MIKLYRGLCYEKEKYRINYIKFFISLTIFILVISISVITIKKLVNKSVENKKKIYLNELQQNEKGL